MKTPQQKTSSANCPRCFEGRIGNCDCFRWQAETPRAERDQKILGNFEMYRSSIRQEQLLQCGGLWKCSNCGKHWFLTPDQVWMYFVEEECLSFVLAWDKFGYALPEDCIQQLCGLGATLRDESYSSRRAIELPCRVVLKNGSICDPALLAFSTLPPFKVVGPGTFLLSEASEIAASAFVLPDEIRFATRLAEWRCKSPEPVFVRSNDGTRFEFVDEHDFFCHPNVKAQELRLAPPTFMHNEKYEQPAPSLFVGKWTEQIEDILLQPFREFKKSYKPPA